MNNNKFLSIFEWINEEPQQYGCIMLEADISDWEAIHLSGIDENDIYVKPNCDEYGLEYTPHVTLLYGIHEDEIDPSVILDMMEQKLNPIEVEIKEIDVFENEEYDVVKYNVPLTKELQYYRNLFLESFENTQTFKDYKPHMTLCYCIKGTGPKYKKTLNKPFKVKFNKAIYSYHKKDGSDKLVRRVINIEPEINSISNDIVKSKIINK